MHRLPRALTLRAQYPIRRQITRSPRVQIRAQSRISQQLIGEPVRFQSVRFKRPGFTLRRAATVALYSGAVYAYLSILWRYLDVEIEFLDEEELEAERGQSGEAGEEIDEEGPFYAEEDSTFIPLTWAKKMPREFYRGSDPEWQEFVKISKDKKRNSKIQTELVHIVYAGSVSHPSISRQLGKDPKIGKYWLDITFPDGPPQEYERSGIEIGDGYVAWSQQKVSAENQWRLMRALWPSAAAGSLWVTTKVLVGIQYRRVKQALGLEGKDPLSPEERYRYAVKAMQKQQQSREQKEVGKAQTEPDGDPSTVVASSSRDPSSPGSSAEERKRLPWTIPVPVPSSTAMSDSTDIPVAMHAFSANLSKSWNPKKTDPPRGAFVVQGLVEVRGARGRMLFDVQSSYDPRSGKYVQVNAGVRSFKRWQQSPRGGS